MSQYRYRISSIFTARKSLFLPTNFSTKTNFYHLKLFVSCFIGKRYFSSCCRQKLVLPAKAGWIFPCQTRFFRQPANTCQPWLTHCGIYPHKFVDCNFMCGDLQLRNTWFIFNCKITWTTLVSILFQWFLQFRDAVISESEILLLSHWSWPVMLNRLRPTQPAHRLIQLATTGGWGTHGQAVGLPVFINCTVGGRIMGCFSMHKTMCLLVTGAVKPLR